MKAKEYNEKLAGMSLEELKAEEESLKTQLFKLRFQQATTYMDNPLQLRLIKRDIARVKTAISAKSNKA
ncbi:MAG: 50S ribosomal protein L29 [Clostridia bacterium]|nr:50S ribosomal protein L29 [Clostridia bacterium]MBO7504216.1 50S ribosomal protein L29 [Clostridia bacterium]MBO7659864.1 50S ribosomal protein L29 [Clostridia bacterium]MBP5666119.1 50S ribosomal protein L29 [Clostridia bacterium]